jgi:hypothetical protein
MKHLKKYVAGLSGLAIAGSSFAAVDPSVTQAISEASSDATTIGAAALVVIVSIWALKVLRRAL